MATSPDDPTKANASNMDTTHDDTALDATATNRRGFLKIGGLGVAVAAFAAACVQQVRVTDRMAQTGTIVPAPSTSERPFPGSNAMDATLALTALSLEKLLVDTYKQVSSSGWVTNASYARALEAFTQQHDAHIPELEALARTLGQDPASVPANATVKSEEVDPMVQTIGADGADKAKAQTDAISMLLMLEDTIAQLYAKAGGEATTRELRGQFSSIGGTEARQYAVLAGMVGRPQAPFALAHTAPAALTDEAYVQPNMPVKTTGTTTGTAKP